MTLESAPGIDYNSMDFTQLEADPVAGPVLQEKALQFLRTEDSEFFNREFSGELDDDGYLTKKDGTSSNTKPSQNITGGMQRVVEMTQEALHS